MANLIRPSSGLGPVFPVVALPEPLGQSGAKNGEWRTYGGDLGSTRYSPLDQINASNFNKLEVAWRFKTDSLGPRPEFNFEGTPLMANGVLYATAGSRRAVVALDPATGELLWMHSEQGRPARRRGAAAALGPRAGVLDRRPGGAHLVCHARLSARRAGREDGRGRRASAGSGVVDLKLDDDQQMDLITGEVGLHAAPIVARNVVIVGAAHWSGANAQESRERERGYVRGFDVRTGKRLWIFHTIPQPGEFGNDTWEKDSWSYTGNTGVWGQISVDEELGLAYLPVELPTGDYYGGHRPGNGLFGESLVAVDLQDRQAQVALSARAPRHLGHGHPVRADSRRHHGQRPDDQGRRAADQAGVLYVFDRVTGQPIWPIEERPVPQGDVPGEWYSPTQPFPTKPPPYERRASRSTILIDFTPELRAEAVELVKKYKMGPMFTPPVVSKLEGPLAPAHEGARRHELAGRVVRSRDARLAYVYSTGAIGSMGLVPPPPGFSDMNCISGNASRAGLTGGSGSRRRRRSSVAGGAASGPCSGGRRGGGGGGLTVRGLPLGKPPYGRITAIDLNKGEIRWQIAHGETPDNVKNHPALKGLDIPAHRPGRHGGHARHQDAAHLGRAACWNDIDGQRGRDAARLRQGDRQGSRRRVHAGARKRLADDLHAERQAVHRDRRQRRSVFG